MIKSEKSFIVFYTQKWFTWHAHCLHKTSKEVHGQFSVIDKIISNVKKCLKKEPSRLFYTYIFFNKLHIFQTFTAYYTTYLIFWALLLIINYWSVLFMNKNMFCSVKYKIHKWIQKSLGTYSTNSWSSFKMLT